MPRNYLTLILLILFLTSPCRAATEGNSEDELRTDPCGWLITALAVTESDWGGSTDGMLSALRINEIIADQAEDFSRSIDIRARRLIGLLSLDEADVPVVRWRDLPSFDRSELISEIERIAKHIRKSDREVTLDWYRNDDREAFNFVQISLLSYRINQLRYEIERRKPASQRIPLQEGSKTEKIIVLSAFNPMIQKILARLLRGTAHPVVALVDDHHVIVDTSFRELATVIRMGINDFDDPVDETNNLKFNTDTFQLSVLAGLDSGLCTDDHNLKRIFDSALSYPSRTSINVEIPLETSFDEDQFVYFFREGVGAEKAARKARLDTAVLQNAIAKAPNQEVTYKDITMGIRNELTGIALSLTGKDPHEYTEIPQVIAPSPTEGIFGYRVIFTRKEDGKKIQFLFSGPKEPLTKENLNKWLNAA